MNFAQRVVRLHSGKDCVLRSPGVDDAAQILEHLRITSAQTPFLARYPEEIRLTEQTERELLEKTLLLPRSVLIAAFVNDRVVGSAGLVPVRNFEKYRHRGEVGLSVQESHWGCGIGSALLEAVIGAAREANYRQLELEVCAENVRARKLYHKFGFVCVGCIPDAYRLRDGSYMDMGQMVLRL